MGVAAEIMECDMLLLPALDHSPELRHRNEVYNRIRAIYTLYRPELLLKWYDLVQVLLLR